MGRIEDLATRYRNHISAPWPKNLAGDQRTIFIVYPKTDERRLRAKVALFEIATTQSRHRWRGFDFTACFAKWMASNDYRETYFDEPDALEMKLRSSFCSYAAGQLRSVLTADDVDDETIVAVLGAATLFGFTRLSLVLKEVVKDIRGRLVLFFPGEYENSHYRLLDARDGWNYLAVPITLHNGVND